MQQIIISGGAGQHDFTRQILADASGKPVVAPQTSEPILLGTALLGATAAKSFSDLRQAIQTLSKPGQVYEPASSEIRFIHDKRFKAFRTLQSELRTIRDF